MPEIVYGTHLDFIRIRYLEDSQNEVFQGIGASASVGNTTPATTQEKQAAVDIKAIWDTQQAMVSKFAKYLGVFSGSGTHNEFDGVLENYIASLTAYSTAKPSIDLLASQRELIKFVKPLMESIDASGLIKNLSDVLDPYKTWFNENVPDQVQTTHETPLVEEPLPNILTTPPADIAERGIQQRDIGDTVKTIVKYAPVAASIISAIGSGGLTLPVAIGAVTAIANTAESEAVASQGAQQVEHSEYEKKNFIIMEYFYKLFRHALIAKDEHDVEKSWFHFIHETLKRGLLHLPPGKEDTKDNYVSTLKDGLFELVNDPDTNEDTLIAYLSGIFDLALKEGVFKMGDNIEYYQKAMALKY